MKTEEFISALSKDLKEIKGAEIVISEMEASFGNGDPIQIHVNGPEQDVLESLAEQIKGSILAIEGVVNPETSAANGSPEINVEADREAASKHGLDYRMILNQVQTNFNGQVATIFREGGDEFDVRIILPEDKRDSISDLKNMFIETPSGKLITLSQVAALTEVQGPAKINRQNQQRQVNVNAGVEGRNLGSVSEDIEAQIATIEFPEGYSYSIGGQTEQMRDSFRDLFFALLFSIFLVYAVMAIQFESFIFPLVVMFSMPTMAIGVLVGLFVTGQPFSIPAFIGIIMLAGIVVNNAIVLVDYITSLRNRGMDRIEAILKAAPSRLRPIFMTSLTTVLGMIPLAFGIGQGGEAQIPLAVVIIFGLTSSMFFTLLLIPVMYTYLEDLSNWIKRLVTGKMIS
jgi:multidrug efflux pump subunit AcrB